jgi:hypothetical protein
MMSRLSLLVIAVLLVLFVAGVALVLPLAAGQIRREINRAVCAAL